MGRERNAGAFERLREESKSDVTEAVYVRVQLVWMEAVMACRCCS